MDYGDGVHHVPSFEDRTALINSSRVCSSTKVVYPRLGIGYYDIQIGALQEYPDNTFHYQCYEYPTSFTTMLRMSNIFFRIHLECLTSVAAPRALLHVTLNK